MNRQTKLYNPQQIVLIELARIFGPGNKTITVSHDPTGEMTGAQFGAYHLSFDLADGQVYSDGTRFTCNQTTVAWVGRKLRIFRPSRNKSHTN